MVVFGRQQGRYTDTIYETILIPNLFWIKFNHLHDD